MPDYPDFFPTLKGGGKPDPWALKPSNEFKEPRPKLAKLSATQHGFCCAKCPCYIWGERKCNAMECIVHGVDIYNDVMETCPIKEAE
jgi:hypothetical protein